MLYRGSVEGNGQFLASRTTEVFYPTAPIKTFIIKKRKKKHLFCRKSAWQCDWALEKQCWCSEQKHKLMCGIACLQLIQLYNHIPFIYKFIYNFNSYKQLRLSNLHCTHNLASYFVSTSIIYEINQLIYRKRNRYTKWILNCITGFILKRKHV